VETVAEGLLTGAVGLITGRRRADGAAVEEQLEEQLGRLYIYIYVYIYIY